MEFRIGLPSGLLILGTIQATIGLKCSLLVFDFSYQRQGAQLVVLEGKRRQVWDSTWSNSCLDLHLMSSGAARAMVHTWLLSIRSIVFEGHELPKFIR